MPSSALRSEAVYHSLLAVSAVRLAWDMIFKSPYPKASAVYQVLLRGYQHLGQASDRMRKTLSDSGSTDLESLITSTLVLVPFAAASQQIDHWISSRSKTEQSNVRLSSTPRNMITFVRGMRGMLEVLPPDLSVVGYDNLANISQGMNKATRTAFGSTESSASKEIPSTSKTITVGSRQALVRLGLRLNSLCSEYNDPLNHELIACKKAFEVLEQIRDGVEPVLDFSKPGYLSPRISIPSRSPSWLRSFICLPCELGGTTLLPHDPLTRLLLSFYAQVPQQYLDIVLPLLDQRLETPADPFSDWLALGLSRTQAFALDVYAHWSVLMSLVEEQSWWIGRLPVTTLDGSVNRYGTAFARRLWPECGEQEEWWPGEMLRVLRNAERMVLKGVEKDN
ncbi:sequence-specific DNA binding RNA polymerase II transcription factor [Ascochyta rabiei]|uniref:Sequence-specific DNA binding RNA polymerase II transcription factor n=2 Tax=Didymella rabiei TaxID=5454 RepID=A0A162YNY5_DIDRA|nr:sequence-specific DNA binding RNA polymerase II transcription factor [Ascochyta rabiei]KZM23701.1 sequence-specific DNA binding RNA polymerase II transcription factor [Ascochyta rabiei]